MSRTSELTSEVSQRTLEFRLIHTSVLDNLPKFINRNASLLCAVAISYSHCPIVAGLKVDCNTEGCANFILSSVTTTNCAGRVELAHVHAL
mmetsp:Transcript_29300/g.89683  ORF Transcript_29300/g.89683 Transcript_29300/m.89683 type:complete len:91 (-) Transcript_29300:451-723(-)